MRLALAGPQMTDWHELRYWCEQGLGDSFVIVALPGPYEGSHAAYNKALMALWDAGIRNFPVTTISLPTGTCHVFWFSGNISWDAYLILSDLPGLQLVPERRLAPA